MIARVTLLVVIFSSMVLAQFDSLHSKLQTIAAKYSLVGMSVAVTKNDSIVFVKGYGMRDLGRSLPTNEQTAYRIASISKSFSAVALMTLYDKGKFKLDDDISTVLGYTLRNPNFPTEPITFRKVLSHTASIREGTGYTSFLAASYTANPPSIAALLVSGGTYYTADMWSSSRPPSANYFQYANINYGLIGALVEKLSGERFDKYCRRVLFAPLGLDASFNVRDLTNINNVAVLYKPSGSSWSIGADNYLGVVPDSLNLAAYVPGTNGVTFAPQGGVRISAEGLARFMLMLQNNGTGNGVRILQDSTAFLMKKSSWIYNGSNGDPYYGIFNQYAFGLGPTTNLLPGDTLIGHPGEAYGLISDMYYSPSKKYGIVFLTNGGKWGSGTYSGWYNVEEEIYKAAYSAVNQYVPPQDTISFKQDFESIQNSGDSLSGWQFKNAQTWKLTGYGHNSDKYAGWDEVHAAEHAIISPAIKNPAVLTFWVAAYNSSSNFKVKVQVSVDGINWIDKGTFVSLGAGGDIGLDFIQKTVNLQMAGTYYIKWVTENLVSGGFYLDDIQISKVVSAVDANPGSMPENMLLHQNYPNPFNPATTIAFYLPAEQYVNLTIYDMLGRQVEQLVNERLSKGLHRTQFDGAALSSGVYCYQLKTDGRVESRKMLLIK